MWFSLRPGSRERSDVSAVGHAAEGCCCGLLITLLLSVWVWSLVCSFYSLRALCRGSASAPLLLIWDFFLTLSNFLPPFKWSSYYFKLELSVRKTVGLSPI